MGKKNKSKVTLPQDFDPFFTEQELVLKMTSLNPKRQTIGRVSFKSIQEMNYISGLISSDHIDSISYFANKINLSEIKHHLPINSIIILHYNNNEALKNDLNDMGDLTKGNREKFLHLFKSGGMIFSYKT